MKGETVAYFDCFAGASGDMILAALIHTGADLGFVQKTVEQLGIDCKLETREVLKRGIKGLMLELGPTSFSAKTYDEVTDVIRQAGLEPKIEERALGILTRLAQAEADVHLVSIREVHFHELSAFDTLVDVVGVCAALHDLSVERISCSPLPVGNGFVETQHGILPLPPPAVMELLRGFPIKGSEIDEELLTPTGAAILTSISQDFGPIPAMDVASVGYGAGQRDFQIPNLLRVILGKSSHDIAPFNETLLIEANIDDMNPEFYEWVLQKLFAAGADDVWLVPAIGKHGRPANVLSVLSPRHLETALRQVLFNETSTLGVRSTLATKWMLERQWREVLVEGMPVRIKVGLEGGRIVNASPEYSDCADVAGRLGLPIKEVFRRALGAFGHQT